MIDLNTDRSFFTVVSQLESGTVVQLEMDIEWDRAAVETMALDGQFDTVRALIEHNPVEGWSRDITAEVFQGPDADQDGDWRADDGGEGDDPADYSSERIDARRAGVTCRRAA